MKTEEERCTTCGAAPTKAAPLGVISLGVSAVLACGDCTVRWSGWLTDLVNGIRRTKGLKGDQKVKARYGK